MRGRIARHADVGATVGGVEGRSRTASNVRSVPEHTVAFVAVRDALLALDDEERVRLVSLLGTMTDPLPPLSAPLVGLLRGIVSLDPADRDRLSRWCGRYLTRFGGVPVAASRRIKPR